MLRSRPTNTIVCFRLVPGFGSTWQEAWIRLRDAAMSDPACRQFRLLRDRQNPAEWIAFSEWDHASDFDEFVSDRGALWFNRFLSGTGERPAYSLYESDPDGMNFAGHAQAWELVPVD